MAGRHNWAPKGGKLRGRVTNRAARPPHDRHRVARRNVIPRREVRGRPRESEETAYRLRRGGDAVAAAHEQTVLAEGRFAKVSPAPGADRRIAAPPAECRIASIYHKLFQNGFIRLAGPALILVHLHRKNARTRFAAMAFRACWPGKSGEESSELVDGLEGARLVADALASYLKTVYVIDEETNEIVYARSKPRPSWPLAQSIPWARKETNEIVYSRRHEPKTRLRSVARRLWTQGSLLVKLIHRAPSVQPRKSSSVTSGFPRLLSLSGRH